MTSQKKPTTTTNKQTTTTTKQQQQQQNRFFFAFQRFGYHVSVELEEKHPQPKFGWNRFMGARDMAA